MKNIKYNLASDSWDGEEISAINDVIKSNRYTMGPKVKKFEDEFASHFNSDYAIMVNSGSSANLLMIASLFYSKEYDLKEGDEVIVPAVSWSTTYYPVHQYGLKLVFVDVDRDTLNISPEEIKKAISPKTKVIFAVNLLGNPCEFDEIIRICKKNNIILIEDNCESLGAKYQEKFTGTCGIMGSFSFFFSHHLQTMEGGMILTNDKNLYELCVSLRAHGWIRDLPDDNSIEKKTGNSFHDSFNFVTPGYGIRPLEMSGAIGSVQLQKLPIFISNRKKNATIFKSLFENEPNIAIQQETEVSSWFGFSLLLTNKLSSFRDDLINILKENNIECRPIVAGNFTKNPVIKFMDYDIRGELSASDEIDKNGFFVGNDFRDLKNEIHYLHELFKEFEKSVLLDRKQK
jgi:CDP-6-deoxy-D-xylo-4-hexulose-3-dehydrase|tara:strand:+ start:2271 stop:3476 length:1206 start_codon:yes stop_codon:yes gene_type:complete